MNFWLNIRLKVRDFFKKHKKLIIIIIIIIAVIYSINYAMKNNEIEIVSKTTNEAKNQVMDTTDKVPQEYEEPINELIDNYFNYCNNKEYENAYNLLSDNFKNKYFKNIDKFKTYINSIFKTKKIYNIQNYSNVDDTYIYTVRIMEDLLATGSNGDYRYAEDKFVVKEENGTLKLALNGYCGMENLNIISEDDYMKIKIVKKDMKYDSETYTIEFKNKTSNYIVLANGTEQGEIALKITNDVRVADMTDSNLIILPNDTYTAQITFDKYFDDGKESNNLIFNAIRILPEYSGDETKLQSEMKKAVKLYSLNINLKPQE